MKIMEAVYLVVLFYLLTVSHVSTLVCEITPYRHYEVEPGHTSILNCTVTMGRWVDKLIWLKDKSELLNVSIDNKYGSIRAASSLQLVNVSSEDSGDYECKATSNTTAVKCSTKLDVFAPPRINCTAGSFEMFLRSRYHFCCSASGYPQPQLRWLFNNATIPLDAEEGQGLFIRRAGHVIRSCVQIAHFDYLNIGTYSCVANNSRGQQKFDIDVTQDLPSFPIVTTTSKLFEVHRKQTIVLQCLIGNVSKREKVQISWHHNENELNNHKEEYFEANYTVMSYLTIANTTAVDAGPYRCKVKYLAKYYDDTTCLIVTDEGLPSVTLDHYNVSTALGSSLSLICTARYPKFADIVQHYWIKNGSIVSSNSRIGTFKRINGTGNTQSYALTIKHFTQDDVGNYTCVVLSILRNISTSAYVRLRPHPEKGQEKTTNLGTLEVIMIVVTSCSSVGVGVVATVRCYFRRKKTSRPSKENGNYSYETFVTYNNKDFDWVKSKLIPLLEKHTVDYCISIRDYEIGKAMIENIADSVYQSRSVIAVLSRNFMSSKKCRDELDVALYRITEKNDCSLIAIRIDAIEKNDLPKALRNRTFLDYTDREERKHWERRLLKHLFRDHKKKKTYYIIIVLITNRGEFCVRMRRHSQMNKHKKYMGQMGQAIWIECLQILRTFYEHYIHWTQKDEFEMMSLFLQIILFLEMLEYYAFIW